MNYDAFSSYLEFRDPENPLIHAYKDEAENIFYVEPGFYEGLMGFHEKRGEDYGRIMEEIDRLIKLHHKVVFTADFENPWVKKDDYIYKEIFDITDPLAIFVEDKSRGSDYGD